MAHAGGRPTVFDEVTLRKLEEAFSYGCTDREACCFADVSEAALYDYQKKYPEFLQRKAILKDQTKMHARLNVARNIHKGDGTDSKWYLERKVKDEFSVRQEQTGADGGPIEIVEVTRFTKNPPNNESS